MTYVVFTDLDGTLLDYRTYSFEAAVPALEILREKRIPLVLCTSKTRAEIEPVRKELHNTDPFISENGGAIFIPKGYFGFEFPHTKKDAGYSIIELGTSYKRLREALKRIRLELKVEIKGFGDFSLREVASLCGFSQSKAKLAKKREYDEPFILMDEKAEPLISRSAQGLKLRVTRGGRFYHLTGENDKGKAVRLLQDMYKKEDEMLISIGLGDSLNDLPMLEAVDCPILVQKPDGSYDSSVRPEGLILAGGPGPSGWREAVLKHVLMQIS